MAAGTTLFRLNVELSNVDRGQYESLELRVAQHPSEDLARVVSRVLAYCLAYDAELVWGPGLDEAEAPALHIKGPAGNFEHWLDVGVPAAERMHRASKAATRLTVVSHKGPEGLARERDKRQIHRAEHIEVWLLEPGLVSALAERMARTNHWVVVKTNGELMITVGETSLSGSIVETTLAAL
jgi:uncharacterized protein YaeQ